MAHSEAVKKKHFQQVQKEFAGYLRSPSDSEIPEGIEPRRMNVYRELIFNNIKGFIESGFPVLNEILPNDLWLATINAFVKEHQSRSPYFADVTKEFLSFLTTNELPLNRTYPFVNELAHYEWVELALMIDPNVLPKAVVDDAIDLLEQPLWASNLAWHLVYEFDVHRIDSHYMPADKPAVPTFLVVYRDRDDDVKFLEINGLTYQLLDILKQNPGGLTGREAILKLHQLVPEFELNFLQINGLKLLMDLLKRNIVITRNHTDLK
ncbi:HvfC family RiPP maturation protein [Pleionea litopenaei]|uniref:DNA-binding domain-containing protein n=1 Tax=Pleionea litopenaei TaxID=3070815 RepID=A0AA51RUX3_9GAMM|nr:putative DNA-binding domain-containing protein [Pleionea sp. HL-JVS1]WMS88146.1 putative DNA-binding domain-containing protein [Pleionea sp. HL-JVS1]